MKSFLITFKPATENPERGWPLTEIQDLVKRHRTGERFQEKWRFHNRKSVSIGDRVFLLLQGKRGPAIVGCGRVTGAPKNKKMNWRMVQFDDLVDPSTEALVGKEDVRSIEEGQRFWRTQASGVHLPDSIATKLEGLIAGKPPKTRNKQPTNNPDWERDELIIALDVYLTCPPFLVQR
jgi:hypothetical protein